LFHNNRKIAYCGFSCSNEPNTDGYLLSLNSPANEIYIRFSSFSHQFCGTYSCYTVGNENDVGSANVSYSGKTSFLSCLSYLFNTHLYSKTQTSDQATITTISLCTNCFSSPEHESLSVLESTIADKITLKLMGQIQ